MRKIYLAGKRSTALKPFLKGFDVTDIDPTENFLPKEGSVIIDTVVGLNEVTLFKSLNDFVDSPAVSVHDYDLLLHLKLLKKLGKIQDVVILGIPRSGLIQVIYTQVIKVLTSM